MSALRPPKSTRPGKSEPFDPLAETLTWLEEKHGGKITAEQKVILPGESFRQWCERLADPAQGEDKRLKVDGKPFRLDDRPAMAWIYDQVPSTVDEAFRLILVLMKSAQVGFTVMEMLAAIYLGLRFGPATIGMFLPDMNLAGMKSSERFVPIVRSVPPVHELMTMEAADGSGRKTGEGNVHRRRIGSALFVFSWTSGAVTTESIPMDVLSFDEVQGMTNAQMEKTIERLSASPIRFTLMGSTANWPDADIDHWYKRGSQQRFHTHCPTCGRDKPLDDYFPQCIQWFDHLQGYRYVCEAGHILEDTQLGAWRADNPDADPPVDPKVPKRDRPLRIRSIHFPQMLSPDMSAGEIYDAFRFATDLKNFYNRKLGKPYLDPSQVPVNLEHLRECERQGIAAGLRWLTRSSDCFMGIDQMGQFNVVVLKKRMPDGRQATVHVEEIYAAKPFERCGELMEAFGVICCVVEINPNYNDAKEFANKYRGRVFICDSFGAIIEGMIRWGDEPRQDASDRRTSDEAKDRYTLKMDQYKCMQTSMARFTRTVNGKPAPACLFPDSRTLTQEVLEKGHRQTVPVLPRMWHHFTKTALVSEIDQDKGTNQYRRVVKKIGIDPHFSYANMLCDVAWSRAHGTATFILPDGPLAKEVHVRRAEDMGMHGLPADVAAMIQEHPRGEVCGNCTSFDNGRGSIAGQGWCQQRDFLVMRGDAGCPFFDAVVTEQSGDHAAV